MKDRTNEEGFDPAEDSQVNTASLRDSVESLRGGKHGSPQARTMIEEILEPENLARAWKRVKANKGAAGIDGMTVGAFPAFARGHWPRIARALMEGTYRPAPVKRVWIIPPLAGSAVSASPDVPALRAVAVRSPTGQGVPSGYRRCWIE